MKKLRIGVLFGGVFLLSLLCTTWARAQVQHNQWSEPHRLSNEKNIYSSGRHAIVADQYGYVHVFWIEVAYPDNRYTIQYARFDGEAWSYALDIYVTSTPIDLLSPAVDANGTLHLIWTQGLGFREYSVRYAQAPAHDALSTQHWSSPIPVADVSAHLIQLQVDSKGVLHFLYSRFFGPDPGIYYTRSQDQGLSWSNPVWLDPDIPPNYGPHKVQFVLDEDDGLHAVWFYSQVEGTAGDWIRYSHSLDGGDRWGPAFTIDKNDERSIHLRTVAGPILIVQDRTVHVVWAAGDANYRHTRFSNDWGRTWSNPSRIPSFGGLNGQAGDGLAIDGTGRVHFLGQIRYPQGIYHAYYNSEQWTDPELIYLIARNSDEPIGSRYHAHDVFPVIRAGNQLVVIFYDRADDRPHALYAMHRVLDDIASLPVSATPTPVATASPSPTAAPEMLEETPQAAPLAVVETAAPVAATPTPGHALWMALIPTLLLVGGTIAARLRQNRNN